MTANGKSRPNSIIKLLMYVMRSIMYVKAATGVRKISSVAFGFSSIIIHYSVNRLNEVYGCFFFHLNIAIVIFH